MKELNNINAYFPFVFSEKLDPRKIFTVGDQVLTEHLFAFHAKQSIKSGFTSCSSDIHFDSSNNSVEIRPKRDLRQANSKTVSFLNVCDSIKDSFDKSQHAPYKDILKNISCDENKNLIQVEFTRMPVNLRTLLTLPDFAIFNGQDLPIVTTNGDTATGPYMLKERTPNKITLQRNPWFPKSLAANSVENAEIFRYNANDTQELIRSMNPNSHHTAYFFGYSISKPDLQSLQEKGYETMISPNEWFTYIKIRPDADQDLTLELESSIERFKTGLQFGTYLGVKAYSVSPSDREYSLPPGKVDITLMPSSGRQFKISTLSTWSKIPFFEKILTHLQNEFPQMKIELLPPEKIGDLFSGVTEIALCPLGISPTDPLGHFGFLNENVFGISALITKKEIANAATISDPSLFNSEIKEFESRVRNRHLIIPIAHFPGVVAYRKDFSIDDNLSFGWGIQLWSLRIN